MFRLWGKEFKDNRMIRDTVICDDSDDTRTHKIFHALEAICYEFDLSKPNLAGFHHTGVSASFENKIHTGPLCRFY